jgi:hypothetical protein
VWTASSLNHKKQARTHSALVAVQNAVPKKGWHREDLEEYSFVAPLSKDFKNFLFSTKF